MYQAGARHLFRVGPRNVLTGLVDQVLGDRPHLAIASDILGRPGLLQLQLALGQLFVHATPVNLDRLFEALPVRRLSLDALQDEVASEHLPPTTGLAGPTFHGPGR